jgi:pyruvate/2-oxoglutarate dehydrogenase complex dihydrolipoamide acyltransferase (E2) component
MATGIYVPIWGLQMTEATVTNWLVDEGRPVSRGQGIVVIETYKISGEVESPVDGILRRQTAQPKQVLPVGSLLGVVGSAEEDEAEIERVSREEAMVTDIEVTPHRQAVKGDATGPPPSAESAPVAVGMSAPPPAAASVTLMEKAVRATPLARKLAREKGVDLTAVKATGRGERIKARDVEAHVSAQVRPSQVAAASRPAAAQDEVVPLTTLRRAIIAKTMQTVNIPYGALSRTVRMDRLLGLRTSLAEAFERRHGYRLTLTHLLFKASALALEEVPILNARLAGEQIVIQGSKNIGMVVTPPGGGGIMIPVIRDVQAMDLVDIAREWAAVMKRIRSGTQTMDDLSGGTFTISNVGALGIDVFTPLIHPPESAILGVSRIVETPVVTDGTIVAGKTASLIVGADHRVFDADPIGAFLAILDRLFQNPEELLI